MKLRAILRKRRSPLPNRAMPGFDEIYYRYWYRDIEHYGGTALEHFLQHGWKEGRDPSAGFSTDGYLTANPDVKAGGHNPLLHFLDYGLAEGRKGYEKELGKAPPAPRIVPESEPQKLLAPPETR